MTETKIEIIEAEFQRVTIGRSDIIVLTYPDVLSHDAHKRIARKIAVHFPGHKVLLLEDGLKLGVLHKDET